MNWSHRSFLTLVALAASTAAVAAFTTTADRRAEAATVTASYEHGRGGVIINGYGTEAMGTFRLRDGDDALMALCVEADVPHSTGPDAYQPVESTLASPRLDALVWWVSQLPVVDDDTAVAASALAWYYADARRSNGPLVWADGTRAFAPISPEEPESWDALAPFSLSHPIGLIVPGTHLDVAERRVAELHRRATWLSGPWALDVTVDPGRADVRLTVDGRPLSDRAVTVTIDVGGETSHRTATTGSTGAATIELPDAPEGLEVRASVDAPGPHREWDGAGPVQRLATATSINVAGSATLGPSEGNLEVHKRSTDATIGVTGARFELRDATGAVVGTAVSDSDGVAVFGPVDRAGFSSPFTVVEIAAPPGLTLSAGPVTLDTLSAEPNAPTVVTVDNAPATASLAVRKVLSVEAVGPPDRRGFEFVIRRREDGASWTVATDADGVTDPVELPIGTYDVCESSVPPWAASLIDTGCREVTIALDDLDTSVGLEYVNEVPAPTIDTRATDATDGDQTLPIEGSTVVDRVELDGLVPGATYLVRGELVDPTDGRPTGLVGRHEFTADATTATIDVEITIDRIDAGPMVVVEEVSVGDTLLARHADLADIDQTVTFVAPTSTTSTTTTSSTTTTTSTTPPTTALATTTTTTTTTTAATSTTVPTPVLPSTLPRTGSDAVATALRLGDLGFVLGVGLFAIAGLVPTRRGPGRDEAGR